MNTQSYRHACEIAFADTDASGWMHFPNVFRYFEEAEHAFLKSHGLLVFDRAEGGWPRVNVSCDYRSPLICGDKIDVYLSITHIGNSSVKWDFEIVKSNGQSAASGSVTTVRVNHEGKPQPLSQ
ncbi:MAG: acyl-CoA thioesterase, partial [Luteolibacter sp.]